MSLRRPTSAKDDGEGEFARADAVAGLAREVDGVRRALDPLLAVPTRVDDLARTVAQLADAVAATPSRPGPTLAPSWLRAPLDEDVTRRLLDALVAWLHAVFLRYPDGAAVLPACWLWHPDVIEELLWLHAAWLAAYRAESASVQLAGDWHDRQRPGVVRRFRASVASCSPERHQTRPGWSTTPTGALPVPGVEAVESIAAWWAHGRDLPAPEPTDAGSEPRSEPGLGDVLNGARNGTGGHASGGG